MDGCSDRLDLLANRAHKPRAHFDPMKLDRRSSFLFGRIFFDEPVSTSLENALVDLAVGIAAAHGRAAMRAR